MRRCAISDRRTTSVASVRSIRSVGTAVRPKPENVRSRDLENLLKTLAEGGGAGGVGGLSMEETDWLNC